MKAVFGCFAVVVLMVFGFGLNYYHTELEYSRIRDSISVPDLSSNPKPKEIVERFVLLSGAGRLDEASYLTSNQGEKIVTEMNELEQAIPTDVIVSALEPEYSLMPKVFVEYRLTRGDGYYCYDGDSCSKVYDLIRDKNGAWKICKIKRSQG